MSKKRLCGKPMYGGVVASFGVEKFSLDNLEHINRSNVDARADEFRGMVHIPWGVSAPILRNWCRALSVLESCSTFVTILASVFRYWTRR